MLQTVVAQGWWQTVPYSTVGLGMHDIKKCPTIICRVKKYRDTGIPWYFVTSSIADNFCKNPTVQIICSALTNSVCHMMLMILDVNILPLHMVVKLFTFMLEF